MRVQCPQFLHPYVLLPPQISWVAVLQDGEPKVVVETFCVVDAMTVVEMDTQRVLVIQVRHIDWYTIGHLFAVSDVFGTVSVVAASMLLSAPTSIVLIA